MTNYRERYNEDGFQEYIQQLIDSGLIQDSALGIAKQVVDKGIASLSAKQKYVFERDVMTAHYIEECEGCGEDVSWDDMLFATDSGYCSYCEHRAHRMQSE